MLNKKYNIGAIFGSAIFLKTISSIFIYMIILIWSFYYYSGERLYTLLIINTALLFQPLSIYAIGFLSKAEGKYTSISRIISYSISAILKIILIIIDASLSYFALAVFLDYSILYIMIYILYKSRNNHKYKLSISKEYIYKLIKTTPLVFFSIVFYTLFLKISIILITYFHTSYLSGIYTAAIRLIEAFYLIPAVIISALYPALIHAKNNNENEYIKRINQLFTIIFYPFIIICLTISLFSPFIINLLYGKIYAESSIVLSYTVWALPFIAFNIISTKYLIIENLLKELLIISGASITILTILILLLSKTYALVGISLSFTISAFISFFMLDLCFKNTRKLFFIKLKSIIYPFFIIYNKFK